MSDTLNEQVGVLTRREIEARILKPFLAEVAQEMGVDKAHQLLRQVVIQEAQAIGKAMRERSAHDDLEAFAEQWEPWFRGGALEIEELEHSARRWRFNVTRCRYAELYKELGMADLGAALSCNRDAALVEGFSDGIGFERSQTIMQGASHCDFHYWKKDE